MCDLVSTSQFLLWITSKIKKWFFICVYRLFIQTNELTIHDSQFPATVKLLFETFNLFKCYTDWIQLFQDSWIDRAQKVYMRLNRKWEMNYVTKTPVKIDTKSSMIIHHTQQMVWASKKRVANQYKKSPSWKSLDRDDENQTHTYIVKNRAQRWLIDWPTSIVSIVSWVSSHSYDTPIPRHASSRTMCCCVCVYVYTRLLSIASI